MTQALFVVGLPLFLGAAALWDLRRRSIPNLLTGAMALTGVGICLAGAGVTTIGAAVTAGVASFAVGLALQFGRLLGGGDVKLFAALAVWLGPAGTVNAALATAIAGGLVALFFLRRPSAAGTAQAGDSAASMISRLQLDDGPDFGRVPYGVAIAAGGMWVWLSHLGAPG